MPQSVVRKKRRPSPTFATRSVIQLFSHIQVRDS